ncbi:regulatory LuxR family protein [Tamaricihabitans halophyticus]|uniref:Regulatory LuxR family protein n=1 Tax=Tamaricihabitans halophyticus TaxID=1262583 RepID=A0A4R2Q1U8_9PSEU|nr:AAA family ATPase [Tamaricihabitans halophyticus]TCP42612.1 regulatory LuxR family protein [Tamaricihabitans halophyticus]
MDGRDKVVSPQRGSGGHMRDSESDRTRKGSSDERDAIVGRTTELDMLSAVIESAAERGDERLAIVGETGVGKSVLLSRLRRQARQAEFLVAAGRATEFELDVPFGLAIAVLDRLFGDREPDLRSLGDELFGELSAVFPALGSTNAAPVSGIAAERFRLYHAVRAGLECVARERGLLVVFDDVHWADEPSAELLAHLLNHGLAGTTCIALAYRPRHLPRPLAQAIASGARERVTRLLELQPLDRANAQALVGADDASFEDCYYQSGGNPFFLTELIRARQRRAGRATVRPAGDSGSVPAAVREAIEQDVQGVSTGARGLAQAAAVLGEPFGLKFAAEVAGLRHEEALDDLDELLNRGLVRTTATRQSYAFRHPVVRHAVYVAAGEATRAALHARAARLLADTGACLTTQAHHVERSALPGDAKASALLIEAATASFSRAPRVAADWFRAALRLLPDNVAADQRIELLTSCADALTASGCLEEGGSALDEAIALVPEGDTVRRARLLGAQVRLEHLRGDAHRAASSELRAALARLGESNSAGVAALTLELAHDAVHLGDWTEAVRLSEQVCAQAQGLDSLVLEASGASTLACGQYYVGDTVAATGSVDRAAHVVDALTDAELVEHTEAVAMLAAAEIGLERYADGIQHAKQTLAISRSSRQGQGFPAAMAALSMAHLWLGNLWEGAKIADAVIETTRLARNTTTFWALGFRSWAALLQGDLETATRCSEQGVAMGEDLSAKGFGWFLQWSAGLVAIEIGDVAAGVDRIMIHCGGPELTSVEIGWRPYCYSVLCSAELSRGDIEAAAAWARRAEEVAAMLGLPGKKADAALATAVVALARGESTLAASTAAEAARAFVDIGRELDAARAWVIEGQGLAAPCEERRATDRFERAYFAFARCGAAKHRDQAAQHLRTRGRRVPRPYGPAREHGQGLHSLSNRQYQVAELIARGLKNREIADELFVSLKTVESHIAQVFEKLAVSSRAAVAGVLGRTETRRAPAGRVDGRS